MNVRYAKILDPDEMRRRKSDYFAFVRQRAKDFFYPDGTYRPNLAPDRRTTFRIFPALIGTDETAGREFALRLLEQDPSWGRFDVFITSSIASILVRERHRLTPALIRRAEEHLDRFVDAGAERRGSSGANDYMFHGYNDNMPALSTRALVFAGDVLGKKGLTEHGLFLLEGLCAHFQRRGLLSEYNSSTYGAVTLTALMDVAEGAQDGEVRALALACARRVLLEDLVHWHPETGAGSGSSSRAYVPDATIIYTDMSALMWYLSGDPRVLSPIDALGDPPYGGVLAHGPDPGFYLAEACDFFIPSYEQVGAEIVEYARRPRVYPHEVRASTDAGRTANAQTRLWQQRLWTLGTASREIWGGNHHHLTLRGTLARRPTPETWKDRLSFWHYLQSGDTDLGDIVSSYNNFTTEVSSFGDAGQYHTVQKRGSALVVGNLGTGLLDKAVSRLKLSIVFSTRGVSPDEMAEDDAVLPAWDGVGAADRWQFLRFGDVYVGIRAAGMLNERMLPIRRIIKGGYLRVEIPVLEGSALVVDREFRKWLDLGYVLEMADRAECGSFNAFRRQCMQTTWEYVHWFYRNSRYCGRHGELQIVDSIEPDGLRVIAVDGRVEESVLFEATGLDPELIRLFPDGRVVRPSRIYWRRDFIGTPFYDSFKQHRLAVDIPGAERSFAATQCASGGYVPPRTAAAIPGPARKEFAMKTYTYKMVGELKIQADVYRPDDVKTRPVLVWLHGGALMMGGRKPVPPDLLELARSEGYCVVSADYRLAPQAKLPQIIEDLRDFMKWVNEEGPELFYADASKVVVSGGSAGGYLTMMTGIIEPRPRGLVAYYGYGDVDGPWYTTPSEHYRKQPLVSKEDAYKGLTPAVVTESGQDGLNRGQLYLYLRQNGLWTRELTGFDPATEKRKLDPYCPVRNITPNYPPIVMLHGTADTDVPCEESVDMSEALKKNNVRHELFTIPGVGHGLGGGDRQMVEKAMGRAREFIKETLGTMSGT